MLCGMLLCVFKTLSVFEQYKGCPTPWVQTQLPSLSVPLTSTDLYQHNIPLTTRHEGGGRDKERGGISVLYLIYLELLLK
jgi:hypothetical protein